MVTSFNSTSDDRIKHNETEIINALDDIRKLKPLKYIKTDKIYEANHDFEIDTSGNPIIDLDEHGLPIKNYIESGFIAQSGRPEIDNLNSYVFKNEDDIMGINCNGVFTCGSCFKRTRRCSYTNKTRT